MQVTGDALKLVCSYGRNTLRARPAPYDVRPHQQLLDGATCEFLMPPQVRNPGILSQSLFRAHQGHIVFIGFLSDMTTMLSVDHHGIVLLWPSHEVDRTGFGWFNPKSTWAMPRTLRTYHARGPLQAVTPPPDPWQSGGRSGSGRERNEAAAARWGSAVAGINAASRQTQGGSASPPKKSKFSLMALFGFKRGSSTGQDSILSLPPWQSEEGDPVLQHHRPWLVRMVWESRAGSARKGGQLVRQTIYRPTKRLGQGKPLVISNISLPEGRIVRRFTQHVVQANLPYQVVAAGMTPSMRDLVIWARVAAQEADPHSFAFFSAHVINIETMRSTVPRIDVYDHSQGSSPPAYAITPVTPAMGTEYMFVGLGCGVVGVYSLATGQLVRELHLGMPLSSSHFVSLSLSEVSTAQGQCKNAGKVLLAAVPSGSAHVYLFEVDDEVGTLEAINARHTPTSSPQAAEDILPKTMYHGGLWLLRALCLCTLYLRSL
ncbi:hypothetical protein DUNSADRAFT_6650 [Dunaliella salina]|uniref:Uncharacterized protein n=1 Tax=Dunaliella salina TaxID=3046 RepID=A0ABQ7GMV9_DUNSA|nr:hypothetical protein DUNSADRAFT_6650 [Dunaliella salina]|eukprot:KAF5835940.1 hypothetical protein DUNSADRAFT_6650 [Dunaliella salina]